MMVLELEERLRNTPTPSQSAAGEFSFTQCETFPELALNFHRIFSLYPRTAAVRDGEALRVALLAVNASEGFNAAFLNCCSTFAAAEGVAPSARPPNCSLL